MTEVTDGLRHKMEVQDDHIVEEVDKLREHYRQVVTPIFKYTFHSNQFKYAEVFSFTTVDT